MGGGAVAAFASNDPEPVAPPSTTLLNASNEDARVNVVGGPEVVAAIEKDEDEDGPVDDFSRKSVKLRASAGPTPFIIPTAADDDWVRKIL